jgi:hypothetical protein
MKKCILFAALFCVLKASAQKSSNSIFLGTNIGGIDLDLSSSGVQGLSKKDFSNSKVGFNAGYRYLYSFTPAFAVSGGLSFNNYNYSFYRPHYNNPGTINPNLSSVKEDLNFYRFAIPVQLFYKFINTKQSSFYLTAGSELNLTNKVKRSADYQIPSPPTGYVNGNYKKNQSIKFDGKDIGLSLNFGLGNEFIIDDKTFFAEIGYAFDLSENTFFTLPNIEDDNSYSAKLKSFQLKIGYLFRFEKKNK